MSKYTGSICPVCSKLFVENDDIVVCPICGAPYHRHCYNEKGKCIFDDLHEKGETWENPEVELPNKSPAYEVKDQECPNCGVLNSHSSLFCAQCGNPLKFTPSQHNNRNNQSETPNIFSATGAGLIFDPMSGVNPCEVMEDNITYGEASKVVQQNTRYFMPVFRNLKGFNKNKFNFSAFLFTGGWLLYRKIYKQGIITSILMFVLYLAQTFTTYFVSLPRIESLLAQVGQIIPKDGALSAEQVLYLSQNMGIQDILVVSIPYFLIIAMFLIMLITGFTANKTYMKHCVKVINKTRNTTINNEDYTTRINEQGGVNTSVTICLIICYFLCSYLPMVFL